MKAVNGQGRWHTRNPQVSGYAARRLAGGGAQNQSDTRIPQEDGYMTRRRARKPEADATRQRAACPQSISPSELPALIAWVCSISRPNALCKAFHSVLLRPAANVV